MPWSSSAPGDVPRHPPEDSFLAGSEASHSSRREPPPDRGLLWETTNPLSAAVFPGVPAPIYSLVCFTGYTSVPVSLPFRSPS